MCYNLRTMIKSEFRCFLKKNKRKDTAIEQILGFLNQYENFFLEHYPETSIDKSTTETLESYVSWLESETRESASKPLWALRYYFDYIENKGLSDLAGELRGERIKRKPFQIKTFRGVNLEHIAKLEALYIENIDQMIDAGRTPRLRQELAEQTSIPLDGIMELVKLCDLARLGAVRSVRARLYHDVGLIPEIIATYEPADLQSMLVKWVGQNNFDGIAPLPKEVKNLVNDARKLPKLVIY